MGKKARVNCGVLDNKEAEKKGGKSCQGEQAAKERNEGNEKKKKQKELAGQTLVEVLYGGKGRVD